MLNRPFIRFVVKFINAGVPKILKEKLFEMDTDFLVEDV